MLDFDGFLKDYKQIKNNNLGKSMWQLLPCCFKVIFILLGLAYIILFAILWVSREAWSYWSILACACIVLIVYFFCERKYEQELGNSRKNASFDRLDGLSDLLKKNGIPLEENKINVLIEEIHCNQALYNWAEKYKSIAKYGSAMLELAICFLGYYGNEHGEAEFILLFAYLVAAMLIVIALYLLGTVLIDSLFCQKYYLCNDIIWDLRQIKLFYLEDHNEIQDVMAENDKESEKNNFQYCSKMGNHGNYFPVMTKIKYKFSLRNK